MKRKKFLLFFSLIFFLFSCKQPTAFEEMKLDKFAVFVTDSVAGPAVEEAEIYIHPGLFFNVDKKNLFASEKLVGKTNKFGFIEIDLEQKKLLGGFSLIAKKEGYGYSLLQDYLPTSKVGVVNLTMRQLTGVGQGLVWIDTISIYKTADDNFFVEPILAPSALSTLTDDMQIAFTTKSSFPLYSNTASQAATLYFDSAPSGFGYFGPNMFMAEYEPNEEGLFSTLAAFALKERIIDNRNHEVVFVSYDTLSNRVEKRFPVAFASNKFASDSLIPADFVQRVEIRTFGRNRQTFGILDSLVSGEANVSARSTTCYALVTLEGKNIFDNEIAYSSAEVYMQPLNETGFIKVATMPIFLKAASHEILVNSPLIIPGGSYKFKVIAYAGRRVVESVESVAVSALPLHKANISFPKVSSVVKLEDLKMRIKIDSFVELKKAGIEDYIFAFKIASVEGLDKLEIRDRTTAFITATNPSIQYNFSAGDKFFLLQQDGTKIPLENGFKFLSDSSEIEVDLLSFVQWLNETSGLIKSGEGDKVFKFTKGVAYECSLLFSPHGPYGTFTKVADSKIKGISTTYATSNETGGISSSITFSVED